MKVEVQPNPLFKRGVVEFVKSEWEEERRISWRESRKDFEVEGSSTGVGRGANLSGL